MIRLAPGSTRRLAGLLVGVTIALVALGIVLAAGVWSLSLSVRGTSMVPILQEGDVIVVDPFSDAEDVERFDVIAMEPPEGSYPVIKRVIAMPGDQIRIATAVGADPVVHVLPAGTDQWHQVAFDAWTDSWDATLQCCRADGSQGTFGAVTVPDDHLFVMGDNPRLSMDSRDYGFIPFDDVRGDILVRIAPTERFGAVEGDSPTLVPLAP